jgi:hypothetical protein
MGLYEVHSVCRAALKDKSFRAALNSEPDTVLHDFDLTVSEREALIAGDVAALYALGAHEYALMWLARAEVFSLTVPEYMRRITSAEPLYIY